MLLDPNRYDPAHLDDETRRLLKATIDWFENRGKRQLIADAQDKVWYTEFLDFVKQEKLFATFCTPQSVDGTKRWDAARNAAFSEVLGFYGLQYWYAWQVTVLGLGPIWMSDNEEAKQKAQETSERVGAGAQQAYERARTTSPAVLGAIATGVVGLVVLLVIFVVLRRRSSHPS